MALADDVAAALNNAPSSGAAKSSLSDDVAGLLSSSATKTDDRLTPMAQLDKLNGAVIPGSEGSAINHRGALLHPDDPDWADKVNAALGTGIGMVQNTGAALASGVAGLGGAAVDVGRILRDRAHGLPTPTPNNAGEWANNTMGALSHQPQSRLEADYSGNVGDWLQNSEPGRWMQAMPGMNAEISALGEGAQLGSQFIKPSSLAAAQPMITRAQGAVDRMAALKSANAVKDDAFAEANNLGLTVPPSATGNAGIGMRIAEGISGSPRAAALARARNEPIINAAAKEQLGIPAETPLEPGATKAVRNEAFQSGYQPLIELGKMPTDPQYEQSLNAISGKYNDASRSFPEAIPPDVSDLVDKWRVNGFDTGDAIKATQILRQNATKAFRAGDNEIGGANRAISQALEDQIERNLAASDNPDAAQMLQNFRDARTRMAQSHTVEDAMQVGSSSLDARKIGDALQNNVPLTGNLKIIGQFANRDAFRQSAKPPLAGDSNPFSVLDLYQSGATAPAGAALGGVPGAMIASTAIPSARVAARYAIMNPSVQRALLTPKYNPGFLNKSLARLLSTGEGAISPADADLMRQNFTHPSDPMDVAPLQSPLQIQRTPQFDLSRPALGIATSPTQIERTLQPSAPGRLRPAINSGWGGLIDPDQAMTNEAVKNAMRNKAESNLSPSGLPQLNDAPPMLPIEKELPEAPSWLPTLPGELQSPAANAPLPKQGALSIPERVPMSAFPPADYRGYMSQQEGSPVTTAPGGPGSLTQALDRPPARPKTRSLLGELSQAGGISQDELPEIGMSASAASKARPGLFRKEGGKSGDSLVEWMTQNGWMNEADAIKADAGKPGGSHQMARDMIQGAMEGDPVIHPNDYEAIQNYEKWHSDTVGQTRK